MNPIPAKPKTASLSPPNRPHFLRMPQVMACTGLSREGVYKYIREGRFPRQIPLGGGRVAWLSSEVDTWLQSRINERNEA